MSVRTEVLSVFPSPQYSGMVWLRLRCGHDVLISKSTAEDKQKDAARRNGKLTWPCGSCPPTLKSSVPAT